MLKGATPLRSAVKDLEIKSHGSRLISQTPTDLVKCPICKVPTKTRNLQRHLNKTHVGVFSVWPRQLNDEPRHKTGAKKKATSLRANIKCCICGFTVSRVRDLKKHMRREHYASRPPARLRRANVPSSLGRIVGQTPTAKSHLDRKNTHSSSVWTVPGGLPDSDRRRH